MANANSIFGARYVGRLPGSPVTGGITPFVIPDTDSDDLFIGDFVSLVGGAKQNVTGQTYPLIEKNGVGQVMLGFVTGFVTDPDVTLNRIYRKGNQERTVWVNTDPYVLFEIQTNGAGSLDIIGKNADIVLGAGNEVYGTSGTQLDEGTASPSTAQLRIYSLGQRVDNEAGQYAKFICFINEHIYKQTAGI